MIEIGEEGFNEAVGLFKAIYTDSPIGIEIYDSKGKLIDLNQSCMELFGVSNKDEVKGFDLFNDPNITKDHLTKLRQRETVRFESSFNFDLVNKNKLYRTTKSGKIHLDVLITPLFIGENKSISNYLVQIQDNSEQKIAEHKLIEFNEDLEKRVQERTKQLRKSEEDWQILVEDAPDIIFTVDRNGRILYINKVLKGITKEEAIGTDIIAFDLTNRESFENVRKWYDIINKVAVPNIILILVGNKVDLNNERQVSTEEGMGLAKELGVYYMETSAKTNKNIGEMFEWVALQIINTNIEEVKDSIFNKQFEEGSQFVISSPQLKLFNNYFTKQLDFCIGKGDTKDIIKYLDILKAIQKNKL